MYYFNGTQYNQLGNKIVASDASGNAYEGSSIALDGLGSQLLFGGFDDNGMFFDTRMTLLMTLFSRYLFVMLNSRRSRSSMDLRKHNNHQLTKCCTNSDNKKANSCFQQHIIRGVSLACDSDSCVGVCVVSVDVFLLSCLQEASEQGRKGNENLD